MPIKVTVFIPTFNRLSTLKRAVESALLQGDFIRVHVLDNASTDGTRIWLETLAEKESRLVLTLRDKNIGAVKNYVDGISSVQTEYCVPLASDDELLPGFLSEALRIAEEDPQLGAVIFQTACIKNKSVAFVNPSGLTVGRRMPPDHLNEWAGVGHYFSWSSILWRRSSLQNVNAQSEFQRFPFPGDAWIQFLVFLRAPVFIVDKPGATLNMHDGQASRQIGVKDLRDVGQMLQRMQELVSEEEVFDKREMELFMRRMYEHWNQVLKWGFSKSCREYNDADTRQAIEYYLEYFFPQNGFNDFPLLPLFKEYREQAPQLNAYKINWMEKSLSWKITKPLRLLASTLTKK